MNANHKALLSLFFLPVVFMLSLQPELVISL